MSYNALARKYRPATFSEVVGQAHVIGTLRAALRKGKLSHAYIFSGPRGCGKTTVARKINEAFSPSRIAFVDQDAYYKDLRDLTKETANLAVVDDEFIIVLADCAREKEAQNHGQDGDDDAGAEQPAGCTCGVRAPREAGDEQPGQARHV